MVNTSEVISLVGRRLGELHIKTESNLKIGRRAVTVPYARYPSNSLASFVAINDTILSVGFVDDYVMGEVNLADSREYKTVARLINLVASPALMLAMNAKSGAPLYVYDSSGSETLVFPERRPGAELRAIPAGLGSVPPQMN